MQFAVRENSWRYDNLDNDNDSRVSVRGFLE